MADYVTDIASPYSMEMRIAVVIVRLLANCSAVDPAPSFGVVGGLEAARELGHVMDHKRGQ